MARSVRGEVVFSTFDQSPADHVRAAQAPDDIAQRAPSFRDVELGLHAPVLIAGLLLGVRLHARGRYRLARPPSA